MTESQASQPLVSGKWIIMLLMVALIGCYLIWNLDVKSSVLEDDPVEPPSPEIYQSPDRHSELTELDARMDAMTTDLHEEIDQITQQLTTWRRRYDELSATLTAQEAQLQSLHQHITTLKTTVNTQPKRPPRHTIKQVHRLKHKPEQLQSNVTLASIDQWGESLIAVLQNQTRLMTLKAGDHYQNWQLVNIDPEQQTVTLDQPDQKSLVLRVSQ